ncbi:hypothetical protein BP5796_02404 [Coleophoma crateriformis]|uniref:Aldehyde dehydrogenase n=1 Tax=Coleophoma crateriformis TaxID=565419 RepID=A0A3D8SYA7_9HELO|nr:hypothetical protein BP5796_02404 [Coleophoma crateriformis]
MAPKIAEFTSTSIDTIAPTVARLQATFASQKTKPIEYRLQQLRQLYWGLVDNADLVLESCRLDLGKPELEVVYTELDWCKNDAVFASKNLAEWMKDEKAPDIPLTNTFVAPHIRKEPLGTVLIIGAYNFPYNLAFGPLIGAIAAGCPAVLKPSEGSPYCAMVMKKIVEESLDPDAYVVVNGEVPETTALLNEKWAKIFYTGNDRVARIISKKAAETLTPVCLELGGRNPAIITKHADIRLAARRLLWGKALNAGQVCISHNYTLVDKEVFPQFIEELKAAWKEFYPNGIKASPDFGRIANNRQFLRIKKMVDESKGKILMGGEMDEATNYIELTVVQVDDVNDSMIKDESFGPLMPIYPVENLDEAIRIANTVHATPLALYGFGTKAETKRILNEVLSGGASINDSFFHASIQTLQFGGVGDSGQGAYRGRASFETFTHRRAVTTTPNWMESLLSIRYPPYLGKIKQARRMQELKPDFDRNGKVVKGVGYWVKFVLGLGASSAKGSVLRWVLLAVIAVTTNKYLGQGNGGLPNYLR